MPGAVKAVKQRQETPIYFVGEAEREFALFDGRVSAIRAQPPLERGSDKVSRVPGGASALKAVYVPRTGTREVNEKGRGRRSLTESNGKGWLICCLFRQFRCH